MLTAPQHEKVQNDELEGDWAHRREQIELKQQAIEARQLQLREEAAGDQSMAGKSGIEAIQLVKQLSNELALMVEAAEPAPGLDNGMASPQEEKAEALRPGSPQTRTGGQSVVAWVSTQRPELQNRRAASL